ncbi:hypothetical protein [Sphingopyxis sp. H115]|nr:hypothetical protein [Sphingopyxis sp. H115]
MDFIANDGKLESAPFSIEKHGALIEPRDQSSNLGFPLRAAVLLS